MPGERARYDAAQALASIPCAAVAKVGPAHTAAVDALTDHVLDVLEAKRAAEWKLAAYEKLRRELFVAAIAGGQTPGQALATAAESLRLLGAHPEV